MAETKSTYTGYTDARRKANKVWAAKQAQIAFRISPEFKAEIDAHVQSRGEGIVAFMTRAIKSQMLRDNLE